MKKNSFIKGLLAVCFVLVGFTGFAQENKLFNNASEEVMERINKAQDLINNKQYASANAALGEDDNEYIIYKRSEIYTKYFVQSLMHQMFIVLNLQKNDDLNELRRNYEGSAALSMYDVEAAVESYRKKNGKNPVLNLTLGNFYYDVSNRYGDQWLKGYDELCKLAKENLQTAYKAGYYDGWSLFALGDFAIRDKNWVEAEKYFTMQLEFEPENASSWYNIALSRMYLGRYAEASEPAKMAIKYELDTGYLIDEYGILADSYSYSGDIKTAEKVLLEAKKKINSSTEISFKLAELYLGKNEYSKAEKELIAAAKVEGTLITRAVDMVAQTQNFENLKSLCLKAVKLHTDDDAYTGFVEYILAQSYLILGDYKKSLTEIDKARKFFDKAGMLEDFAETLDDMERICNEK